MKDKQRNELLIRRLIIEATGYLHQMEALLTSVDNRLAVQANKKAA